MNLKIRNLLFSCGVVGYYTGHSFRIGAATTAAGVGLPVHLIKTVGRWSSDAYKLYIRMLELDIAAVSSKLLNLHVAALHMGVELFLSVFMWLLVKFSRSQQFKYKGISFIVFLLAGVCSASNLGLIKLREVLQFFVNNRVNLPLKAVSTKI